MMELASYEHKTRPYRHQRRYLEVSRHRRAFALLSDMGTGKSKMLIDEMAIMLYERQLDAVLVTTAKGNYDTWPAEIKKHLPDDIPRMVHLWDGRDNIQTRSERRALCEGGVRDTHLRVLVMNIEALTASTKARTLARQFLSSSRKRMIVVDESTLIKGWETIRSRELVTLGRSAEFRRIATGNPTPNSPLDLWGQFEFLRAGGPPLLGFNSFYAFRARYSILGTQHIASGRTIQVPVEYRNLDELASVVAQHSFRVTKEECLDLPQKIYTMRRVELTKEQREIYESLRLVAVAELDALGATISSTMAIGVLTKLHQVICGQVLDDDGVPHEIPNNRLSALLDVVRESGRQTIVWSAYRLGLRAICRELRREFGGESVVEYHGSVSPADRSEAIRKFQSGAAHFFVATPHTGARGITLTAGKTVVYYSNTFNLEHRLQSEDRAHRIGQTESVNYVDLCAGGMDERVIRNLRAKISLSSAIMGDGPKTWLI